MVNPDVSVIRLMDADVNDSDSVRALLADALSAPRPRVLADLSGLHELGGPLIAAMLIVAGELGPDGRFAIYAPRHIFEQMHDWRIAGSWPCFDQWSDAAEYLCGDAN